MLGARASACARAYVYACVCVCFTGASGASLVLHWCFTGASGASLVLHWCFWCFTGASLAWCSTGASLVLHWCFPGAPLVLQVLFLVLHWCFWCFPWCSTGASGAFPGRRNVLFSQKWEMKENATFIQCSLLRRASLWKGKQVILNIFAAPSSPFVRKS